MKNDNNKYNIQYQTIITNIEQVLINSIKKNFKEFFEYYSLNYQNISTACLTNNVL